MKRETPVYPIRPVAKHYAWGSYTRLQSLFGMEDGRSQGPLAEMWFSGHSQWPSSVSLENGVQESLTSLIRTDPQSVVGQRCSEHYGPMLPYLLKIISARIPLSLQVHPVGFEARAGFNRQNAEHVPFDDPGRSFKDPVAKSEMVVALEPFEASVGFASKAFMLANLTLVDHPVARRMVRALTAPFGARQFAAAVVGESGDGRAEFAQADAMMPVSAPFWPASRRRIFRAFHTAVTAEGAEGLPDALNEAAGQVSDGKSALAFSYACSAAESFRGDPSILALLMMNPVSLQEGESVFIPAGMPHAYIHGTAAEIMTNSDNVLRAGMTSKTRDVANLLHSLNCKPSAPIDPSANALSAILGDRVIYRPHIDEFMLVYGHVGSLPKRWRMVRRGQDRLSGGSMLQRRYGPRVVVCTEGALRCTSACGTRVLHQGDAVFVSADEGRLDIGEAGESGAGGSYLLASTQM